MVVKMGQDYKYTIDKITANFRKVIEEFRKMVSTVRRECSSSDKFAQTSGGPTLVSSGKDRRRSVDNKYDPKQSIVAPDQPKKV